MQRSFGAAALCGAMVVSACGGGSEPGAPPRVEELAKAPAAAGPGMPLAADVLRSPRAAAAAWKPGADALMDWAETAYPQHFPAGPLNRFWDIYTFRQYPQTGNILAVAGQDVYILGPVSGGVPVVVGTLTDFTCRIDPAGCFGSTLARLPAAVSSGPAVQNLQSDLTAVLRSPSRIDAQVLQAEAMTGVSLTGSAVGNLAALNGRTLYIIVEDPHSLFQATPSVSLSSTNLTVSLAGRTQAVAGLMEGSLKVHACLDPQCHTALGGSPLLLPYSVSVLPPLAVEPAAVSVSVPFGQVPQAQTVRVNLPQYTTGWNAALLATASSPPLAVVSHNQWGNTVGYVRLDFAPAAPGTTNHTLRITGGLALPSGRSSTFSKDVPITYTVSPNGAVDYVIAPAATVAPLKFGDNLNGPTYPRTVAANTGVTVRWGGIEYLTAPAAAAGNPKAQAWWSELNSPSPSACNGLDPCLPVGTYTARIRYTVSKSGSTGTGTAVYHPVTLQVYP